ncbi:MAG: T9SS type A sorting domain-containing protein [Bacteroidales bacterium]|nr:T9SS type A sorting domain-containing protein [Bacteroidales bacterium]
MKKNILFLSVMLISFVLFAQTPVDEGWIEIGNASDNSELNDIDFVSSTTGFAVGTGGAFLKTTDGGITWSTYDIGVGYELWQIQFTSPTVGYIIGGNDDDGNYFGKVLRTNDGGSNWTEIYSQTSELNDIYFLNDSVGWVSAYEKVLLTSDSGSTWTTVTRSGVNSIYNIWFVTASKGYHSGANSKFYSSVDGGNTWGEQATGQYLTDLWFSDPVHGYYLNNNRQLLSSVDSGNTWSVLYTFSELVKDVRFLNSTTGFVLNHLGTQVYLTTDAGTTWNLAYQSANENFNHIELDDNGKLLVVGKGGLIVSTSNGVVWDTLHLGAFSGYINDVQFINDQIGIAVGDNGKIKRTTDGGNTWVIETVHPYKNLKGVSFFDPTAIFIAGEDSLMLKSIDSAQTWSSSATGFNLSTTRGIDMYSSTEGFAFGGENIYKTNDGGSSWAVSGTFGSVYCATALNNDSVYFGGSTSFGYTFDGGNTWTGPLTATNIIYGLHFLSADTGIYVNSWGKINKTTNRGVTWTQVKNIGASMYDVTFFDDTTAYTVGHNGAIFKSEDAGNTWFQIESHTQRSLRAIWFTPDGTGYIVGQDGMILRKSIVPVYQVDFVIENYFGAAVANATMDFNSSVYPVGTYTANGLVAGSYNYSFTCTGYLTQNGVLNISSDTTITLVLNADISAPVVQPAASLNDHGFTAEWTAGTNATEYALFVSDDNFITNLSGYDSLVVSGLNYAVSGLTPGMTYYYRLRSVNAYGVSDYSNTGTATTTTSLEEVNANRIHLYPNPASDYIVLDINGSTPAEILVYNIAGDIVIRQYASQKTEIQVSGLPEGMYYVRFADAVSTFLIIR